MLQKKFFKTKEEVDVTFKLDANGSKNAAVVCEANGWQPIPMKKAKKAGSPFRAKVRLPKDGRFQFRYLLDGQEWANDDAADAYWTNEFGGENSVVFTSEN